MISNSIPQSLVEMTAVLSGVVPARVAMARSLAQDLPQSSA